MKTTDQPIVQNFQIEGVKHISVSDAFEAINNGDAVMLDVRELNEVQAETVPLDRLLNHPMSVIMDRLSYIAKDQNIIVACPGGVRSVKVANMLNLQGYPNVANLDGGLMMWKAKGLPMESNLSFGGCGCNSGTPSKSEFTSLKIDLGGNLRRNTDFKNLKRS
jgi:rhodanese-related sulfurtransferase